MQCNKRSVVKEPAARQVAYRLAETADVVVEGFRKHFTIAAIEPWFWETLCRILGRNPLSPGQNALRTRTRDEGLELLKDRDISVEKVYTLEEAVADPRLLHRGMVVEVRAAVVSKGKAPRWASPFACRRRRTVRLRRTGPVTGQHPDPIGAHQPGLHPGAGGGVATSGGGPVGQSRRDFQDRPLRARKSGKACSTP